MHRTTYTVDSTDHATRLDRWCQRILGRAPNSVYQKALRKGLIRLNGTKTEGSVRVNQGDTIEVRGEIVSIEKQQAPRPKQTMKLTLDLADEARAMVQYKDKDIIIINKPAGLAVQGGSKVEKHLDGMLPALHYDAKDIPRLVHRLDKDTSGVMVLARHAFAAAELQRAFANKKVRKTYLALVVGAPKPASGEIESNLDKLALGEGSREMVRSVEESGKRAVTRYKTLEHLGRKLALVELEPVTGRTHQLRVHMAEMDCPIMGDGKYGGRSAHVTGGVELSARLHLQAWRLYLPPMFGKESRTFEAVIAPHISRSMEALGLTLSND